MASISEDLAAAGLGPRDMLLAVNQAIKDIFLTGQSYTISGRSLTRGSLAELRSLRQTLMEEAAAEEQAEAGDGSQIFGAGVAYFVGTGR